MSNTYIPKQQSLESVKALFKQCLDHGEQLQIAHYLGCEVDELFDKVSLHRINQEVCNYLAGLGGVR